ncbi:MAG TPA: peptide ABC transporter substrate-binding protein [Gemmatimonadaceae bacterium]|nr:peptide ABC transporter substrate-binding protein [Gemmatimonadaceae bacterium]
MVRAIVCAVAIAGCGDSPPASVVVFASGADLESANPLVTTHPLARQVQRHVLFTTLARYDSSLAPAPYLARAWSWSADRRTLTFTLNGGVRWQDSTVTTARDVAFTVLAARDPVTGYARGGDLGALDTAIAVNDSTVTLRFNSSQPTFPLVLCELAILPEHALRDVPRKDMRRAAFSFAPIGNGPFTFAQRVAGQRWTFNRNDAFPASLGGPPVIERLVVAVVDEPTTKFAGLASGDLDFAGIAPTMASLVDNDPTLRVLDYPILFSTALVFNVRRAPFDDARVRRAISLSLDRERIVSAALSGFGTPASGPVVPESPYALEAGVLRDKAVADSLLDAAGWRRDASGARTRNGTRFSVQLLTVGSGDHAIEQLVQADLAARGVHADIRDMEMGAFLTVARGETKNFDFLVTGVTGDVSLAYISAMYESRQHRGALDYSDFHTPELDALFARARSVTSDSARVAVWRDVQRVLAREMPAAWIYHARGLQGISRRMDGVVMDLRGELTSVARWTANTTAR